MFKYIEKHINRKVTILKWLFENKSRSITISFLQNKMQVSKTTIMKDINDLKCTLNSYNVNLVIEKNELSILNFDGDIKDVQCYIYEQSDFLYVMRILLINGDSPFCFNEKIRCYYSRAKFYSIKKRVNEFLDSSDLSKNLIRKILFISWLEYELGIQCIPDYIKNIYEQKFKNIIDKLYYLTNSEKKKFNVVLQTFFIFEMEDIEVSSDMFFLDVCLSDRDSKILEEINKIWKTGISRKVSATIFFYKLLSSNFLMPMFLSKEHIDKLLSDSFVKKIIYCLEKTIDIELCVNYKFLGILFNFIKYRCLNVLDLFIPNEPITTLLGESIYLKIKSIFKDTEIKISDNSLRYLSNKLLSLILEKDDRVKLYICSESLLGFYEIYYFLKQNLKIDVELVDVWLSQPDQLLSIEGKKRIVILDCDFSVKTISLKTNIYLFRKPFHIQNIEKLSAYILKIQYDDIRNDKKQA